MLFQRKVFSLVSAACISLLCSCLNDKYEGNPFEKSQYPDEVAKIMVTKCAVPGCHNTQSADGAAGLDLSTWEKMFDGSRGGTAVIPYRSDQSFLINFINTYDDIDSNQQTPLMPLDGEPLSREEVLTIKSWIDAGAPDRNGFVKFSDNPFRKKFYVANKGCDEISVFDAERKVTMRMITAGNLPALESPGTIRVSPDGLHWYMILESVPEFYKFRTSDDSLVAQVDLGGLSGWKSFSISCDSKKAALAQLDAHGSVAFVNLETMILTGLYAGYTKPQGCVFNQAGDTAYVLASTGNYLYKVPADGSAATEIALGSAQTFTSDINPYDIIFSPDYSAYFVTCRDSDQVRAIDASNDQVIAIIPAGDYPQMMAMSHSLPYLFVTNMQSHTVTVIDYQTFQVIKTINAGFNPHGISVNDADGHVYVACRNVDLSGCPPHHSGNCDGRNGYLVIINLNTLDLIPGYKHELLVDPFSVSFRP